MTACTRLQDFCGIQKRTINTNLDYRSNWNHLNVEVKLELGHKAAIRSKSTTEGFTHDWTLFVRGPEGCSIQHFVEKVVFFLHESFPKPKRVLKEPPYNVSESGYAGFNLSIEVHFRNKEDPKKVHFDYDLYLQLEGPPINNCRLEKLTFQNPNSEFKKKLLKGGGVAISGGSQSSNCSNSNPVHTETEQTPKSKSSIKGSNEGPKKTPKVKLPYVAKDVPAKVPEPAHQPFTQIFGAPIKTKPSPETCHKSKENTKEKSSSNSKTTAVTSTSSTDTTLSSSVPSSTLQASNNKPSSKDLHKSSSSKEKASKSSSKESEKKESKSNSQSKSSNFKRLPSPSQNQGQKEDESTNNNNNKKRKRSTSTSSTTSSVTDKASLNKDKKSKSKDSDHKVENKAVTTSQGSVPHKKESQKQGRPSQVAPRKEPRGLKSPVHTVDIDNDQESLSCNVSGRGRVESGSTDSSCVVQEKDEKPEEGNSRSSSGSASSPASSLSLSSVMPGSAHGPLATMMAQMEQELVSPLSSVQGSPAHSVASPESEERMVSPPCSPKSSPIPNKVEKQQSKKNKEKSHVEKLPEKKKVKEETNNSLPPPLPPQSNVDGKQQPIDAAYLRELMQLQERIMALRDKQHLQRIVDVIEETGLYQITSSTIDFDLCALDRSTVQKLQNCMAVT